MMDPSKLQRMTMAMRLTGFANGIDAGYQNDSLRHMLKQAAQLLLEDWNLYAAANGYDQFEMDGTTKKSG